jgi:regulatory protein
LHTAALTLLSRRDYTTAELRQKLTDRGYAEAEVTGVLDDLTARGLLDDRRVAAAHVRSATAIKGRGRHRIARELAARGISRDIADELLASVEARDETAAIRRILERKRWPVRPSLADKRKMFQHLMRRGFPVDAIRKALGRGTPADIVDD